MKPFFSVLILLVTLALMAVVIFGPSFVHAETIKPAPKPLCGTMEEMKASLRTVSPPLQVSEVGPYGTRLFLALYNAIEPVSNIIGDHTLLIEAPGSPKISVVVFRGGCMANFNSIDRGTLRRILRSV